MRPLLLALALAACVSPGSNSAPPPDADAEGRTDERADERADGDASPGERADAAGLSDAQARRLTDLDVPVIVPVLTDGWALHELEASAEDYGGDQRWPSYALHYRHDDGRCFDVNAGSEGIGDVFMGEPPHGREVDVPGIAAYGPAYLGYAEAGDEAEGWEAPEVQTEWLGADGIVVHLGSRDTGREGDEGCLRLGPEEAAGFIGSLRYLDPADDVLALGLMSPRETMEEALDPETLTGPDPETAARRMFEGAGEARATTVETLPDEAGDARRRARDAHRPRRRLRARRADPRGLLAPPRRALAARRRRRPRYRCHRGRGQADWGAALCQ